MRLALVIAKRYKRDRRFGWQVLAFPSSNDLGLIGHLPAPLGYLLTPQA